MQRAKLARTLGFTLALAGLLPILWYVAASFHPLAPRFPIATADAWLPVQRITWIAHPMQFLIALAGLAVMWLGATIVARQNAAFESYQRATEDRLRRVREYGSDGRIEPYIGSPLTFDQDNEPG